MVYQHTQTEKNNVAMIANFYDDENLETDKNTIHHVFVKYNNERYKIPNHKFEKIEEKLVVRRQNVN